MDNSFYDSAYQLCRSIISQRLFLIRHDKSKLDEPDKIRLKTENLRNDFEKYKMSSKGIAHFIKNNYSELIDIIVHTDGFESRIERLTELRDQSQILN